MTLRTPLATLAGLALAGLALATGLQLSGCATYYSWSGVEATDLSTLKPGVKRSVVEDLLGKPSKIEKTAWLDLMTRFSSDAGVKAYTAYYDYDRGSVHPGEDV